MTVHAHEVYNAGMNLKHLLLAALAACSTGLFAKTTETDWATFEYPDLWDIR